MKTVEIHYGDDVFSNQLSSTSDKRLQSCKLHRETSFASDSLSIDYITYYVVSDTNLSGYFDYSTPQYLYDDGELVGIFYAPEVTKESKRFYKVIAYSNIAFLDNMTHFGGVYAGTTAGDLIADIMGDIPYTIDSDVAKNTIYGWLPYDTARNNLSQVLFVLGAGVYRDEDYQIYIRYATSTSLAALGKDIIYTGASESEGQAKTLAMVYSHKYVKGGETVTLMDETASGEVTILFDEPVYDLSISGGTITESSVNHAVINATGAVTLTGTKYAHSSEVVLKGDADADSDYIFTVEDATLVSAVNAVNVARRVYKAGKYAGELDYGIYDTEIIPGASYNVRTMEDGLLPCVASAVDVNYSAKNRSDCNFIIGTPLGNTSSYDISLSQTNVTITYKVNTISVIVTAMGDWTAESDSDWILLGASSGQSGDTAYITSEFNSDESSRVATVTFTYTDGTDTATATLVITQTGIVYEISASPSTLIWTYAGGNLTITITCTTTWSLDSYPSWITPSATTGEDGDSITLTADENTDDSGRAGALIFSCEEASVTVPATQKAENVTDTIILSSESGTFDYEGESKSITLTSSSSWAAEASDDWISLDVTSGVSGDSISITTEENSEKATRSGYVTFTCGGAVAVYLVTQNAFVDEIYLSQTSINFDEYGDTESLTVTANGDWSATVVGDWFMLSTTSGSSGSTALTVTAPPNYEETQLTGTVVFTCGTASAALTLTQDADTTYGNEFNYYAIYTSAATFTVPDNVKRIRIILIGGGNGGENGADGESSEEVEEYTYSYMTEEAEDYSKEYTTGVADAGSGGTGGAGGASGKLYQADLEVTPGDTYKIAIGAGGSAGGGAGGNSTFGSYSSANGSSPVNGFQDAFTENVYCMPGTDGGDGGDGGDITEGDSEYSGNSGGNTEYASGGSGVPSYSTEYTNESYYKYCYIQSGAAGGGGAGGGAGNNAGSDGTNAVDSELVKAIPFSSSYSNKYFINAVTVWNVFRCKITYPDPGDGGDGADAEETSVSLSGYGAGGNGGGGGGGAGSRGENYFICYTYPSKAAIDDYSNFEIYVTLDIYGYGGSGGSGGSGSAGTQGCVIIYY